MKKSFTLKNKILKGMKICSLQVVIATTLCSLAFAHDNFAQVLDKKITITLKEVPIEEALDAVGSAAGVKFFYSIDQLNVKDKLTLNAVNRSLREILEELLSPYHVKYKVHEKKLEITLKREDPAARSGLEVPETGERLVFASSGAAPATITGTVTDAATQQPMAGVNIVIKGSTEGTTTDSQGAFNINAEQNDILVFSFIGYRTFETTVGEQMVIDVALEEDVKNLKEVEINAGYYKTTREFQTGNISSIRSQEIEKQPVASFLAALQGRIPGLEVTQLSGVPGGNFKVRIRGQNSIGNGNDPLYIIDGVPYTSTSMASSLTSSAILPMGTSPLNNLNPLDIESIEVLKDASSTAIYGSRGANGVILITTKQGQVGKPKLDFNFYTGIGEVTRKIDLLNTLEYLEMRKEAVTNDGFATYLENPAFDFVWPDLKTWDSTRYTDWQKKMTGGSAHTTDFQTGISGGEKNYQYSFGGGYHRETTVFPGDNADQKISAHLSLTNKSANEKLTTSLSLNYSINNSNLLMKDLTSLALTLPPNGPELYNDSGDLNWAPDAWNQSFIPHPLAYLNTGYEAITNNLLANSYFNYAILPNLSIKTNLGYTDTRMESIRTIPVSYYDPAIRSTKLNESTFASSNFSNWIIEPQANWKPRTRFGQFDILIGTSFLDQKTDALAQFAKGFPSEALMKNIGAAASISLARSSFTEYRYHAIFGRINYNLNGKYVIDLTARKDGSSRFGPGKQFAQFGAVGTAWIFSKEAAIKNALPFISFGKIWSSYGTTGNDQIGDYQYLDTYTSSPPYQGNPGLMPVRLSNPDFSWETNKKLEAGAKLSFIEGRINAGITYYHNTSSNQLIGFSLPPTTGFNNIQGNLPATVQNTGFEIEFASSNIENSIFSWSTSFNMTIPKNKLVEFPDLEESDQFADILVVGEPLSIRKTYHYLGVNSETGLYEFEDVNGDGTLDHSDRQTIKFT